MFDAKLKPIARTAGALNLEELVNILRGDSSPHLHLAVAEAMTINETSFFRDRTMFDALRENILPRLIEANSEKRRLRIWSAACSAGQEAYSMAMLICDEFPALANWDVKVTGTDLSRQMVEYARRGRFRRMEVNRGLPARMLVKHFERDGEEWEIASRLRAMCEFQCVNLSGPLRILPVFDLVLLRNVLLYFAPPDRNRLFRSVHRHLSLGGYLVLGASEQAEDSTTLFRTEFFGESYFYRPVSQQQVGGAIAS
jgi:chemotaxis protein methyltransferase CheR